MPIHAGTIISMFLTHSLMMTPISALKRWSVVIQATMRQWWRWQCMYRHRNIGITIVYHARDEWLPAWIFLVSMNRLKPTYLISQDSFWDPECAVVQFLRTPLHQKVLPMWGAECLCLHTICSAHPAPLLHCWDWNWSSCLLWLCTAQLLRGLPSPCLWPFCSCRFWIEWDNQYDLQRERARPVIHYSLQVLGIVNLNHQSLSVTTKQEVLVQVLVSL